MPSGGEKGDRHPIVVRQCISHGKKTETENKINRSTQVRSQERVGIDRRGTGYSDFGLAKRA